MRDHDNDTDDVVEEFSDVQSSYQHEGDTDDVVEEYSDSKDARGSAVDRINMIAATNQEKMYSMVQHDLVADPMNVQISELDHDNDTEDIPEGMDPLSMAKHKKGEPFKTIGELMQERADISMQEKTEEIASIQSEQASQDKQEDQYRDMALSLMQKQEKARAAQFEDMALVQTDGYRIPHENDTDDVAIDNLDFGYNKRHSKQWNEEVNKKAEAIENEIKIQENLKVSEKKAKEDAKRKAEQEKIRKAEEKRKQLEEEQRKRALGNGPNKKTIDLGELYGGLENIENVQLDYERHSKYMQSLLDEND